jgi:predicted permease
VELIRKDIRFSLRALGKNPGYTLLAILALALGIGANTAIFSIVYSFMFRPMQGASNPRDLVSVVLVENSFPYSLSYPDFEDYGSLKNVFSDSAGYFLASAQMRIGNHNAERFMPTIVTSNYFDMLGVKMAQGRSFTQDEARRMGAGNVCILAYQYWQRKFHSDPQAVGSIIQINGHAFTIIGIASKEFSDNTELIAPTIFVPLTGADLIYPDYSKDLTKRTRGGDFNFVGRLRPGVNLEKAQAAVTLETNRLAKSFPDIYKAQRALVYPEPRTRMEPSAASYMPPVAMIFMILVALVLLAACANVASLFYARASGRQKELAIRVALGAGRGNIIRQLLTESLILSLLGALAGILLARWITNLLSSIRFATDLQLDFHFTLDYAVIGYSLILAILSGLLAGMIPGLRISHANLIGTLREGGQTSKRGSVRQRLRDALVVLQVAVSLVLLVCAGLFLQSTFHSAKQDVGIQTHGRVVMAMDTDLIGYDKPRSIAFYRQLLDRVRSLPGVKSAALGRYLPIGFRNGMYQVFIEGAPEKQNGTEQAFFNIVSSDYFHTVQLNPLEGRVFTRNDNDRSKAVAVINEAMAKKYWPGQNPIGKRFRFDEKTAAPVEVVGIVRTGKYILPAERPLPAFYLPFEQNFRSDMVLHVYTERNKQDLIVAARKVVSELDPEMPVWDVRTLDDHIRYGKMRLYDVGAGLIGGFGMIALLLAAVGLYGVMAFLVNQRTQEIGLRMALGASQTTVLKTFLSSGMKKTLIGLAIGAPLAYLATNAIRFLLVGISPKDPATILVASLFLLAITLLAIVAPAVRASRVDPLVALRSE